MNPDSSSSRIPGTGSPPKNDGAGEIECWEVVGDPVRRDSEQREFAVVLRGSESLPDDLVPLARLQAVEAERDEERERVREALLSDDAVEAAREAIGPRGLGSIAREIVPRILEAALASQGSRGISTDEGGRSPERTDCLADILITAVEDGGLNGWRQVSGYSYTQADPDDVCSMTTDAKVTVHELEEYGGRVFSVTLETIATGLGRVARGEVGANREITDAAKHAQRDNDAGYFDAYSADAVLQAGLFGELVYG